MPHDPLVTTITAAYNRAKVLRYAIESVRRQTYQNWQYIIVGDCCTDATADRITELDDPRIEFHNLAFNFGSQNSAESVNWSWDKGMIRWPLTQQ